MRRFGQGFKLKKEIRGKMRISFIFIIGNKNFQKMIFFLREFQPMAFAPNNSSLSSNQDTNQFLV